jgi:hypothetical protein
MAVPLNADTSGERDRGTFGASLLVAAVVLLAVVWLASGSWGFHEARSFWADLALQLLLPVLVWIGLAGLYAWLLRRSKPMDLLHPEHRAAIGTPEEHERLQRAMAV